MLAIRRLSSIASQIQARTISTRNTFATMTDTSKWKMNHTMLRVKDAEASIKYYEFLGMKQINKMDFPDNKFSLYFLAYDDADSQSTGKHWTDRQGVLELTHNYGTEKDNNFKVNNGNSDPGKGFGHVCVSVDNIQAACKRIEDAGYKFQKKLTDGRMRSIAFALDPDGYWVEIIGQKSVEEAEKFHETNTGVYRFNHSMIRVKDAEASLKFYQEALGMKLYRTSENSDNNFNLYFLGYPEGNPESQAYREGIVELTWNYGTEKDADFKYHNGNDEPQGFGHLCVSVDDLDKACEHLDQRGVKWKKRLTEGRMKDVAFVLDPDGYWIEVIQNQSLKKTAKW